ncbi:DUF2182 domain-containing protein [uncultured Dokdonia sp.]|uniref:copper chaperone n=1 Tax=uncultured Dokdonia sp. TaxID=575653 RepID=UPI0026267ECC|nr:DUF2182 domain-containing protein [uncultured Dokdonia sp.]
MKIFKNLTNSISFVVITVSFLFWMILLFDPLNIMGGHSGHGSHGGHEGHMEMTNTTNTAIISGLMIGWIIMVVAMMLPKLISPIEHIYLKSLKRKRISSIILFITGYVFIWTIVGLFMNLIIVTLTNKMPGSYIPALIIGGIAIVWQFSPIKQRFLNLGHDHRAIKAFGWSASKDACLFGMEHGIWCFGSGWALMWFPMLLPQGHNLAMLLVMFMMVSEHMEQPQLPRWRFDFRMKLWRILKAQTKLKLSQTL